MAIRTLYISDLDGTLLNSEKEVSEYTKNTLNSLMKRGANFSIATARTAASALKIISGLEIHEPVVLMNGAVVYDINESRYMKTEAISIQTADEVLEVLNEYGISGFMYAINNNKLITYYENLDKRAIKDFHDERVIKYQKHFEQVGSFLDKIKDNRIIYFTLIDDYEALTAAKEDLKNYTDIDLVLYKDIYAEDLWYLEIFSKNASKYNAVKFIREYCKYDRVIGFGDNVNDVSLFKACDECYAVSNAVEELRKTATSIINDNNSDGVARFIARKTGMTD